MKKVALFVDVQNVYYTTKEIYQSHFNYTAFWQQCTNDREVIAAYAYAIDRGDERQRQFQNILRGIGFTVKLKPFINRQDGTAKGDWDVGITLDMIELADQVDIIVLASGDGDFDLLIKKAKERYNVEVEVYGVPQLTARTVIQSATRFIPIKDHLLLGKCC